jgi:hypothetical protein
MAKQPCAKRRSGSATCLRAYRDKEEAARDRLLTLPRLRWCAAMRPISGSRTACCVGSATSPCTATAPCVAWASYRARLPPSDPWRPLGTQWTLAAPSARWTPRVRVGHTLSWSIDQPCRMAAEARGRPRAPVGSLSLCDPTPLQKPPLATLAGAKV